MRNYDPLTNMRKRQSVIFDKDYYYYFKRYIDQDNNCIYESVDGKRISTGDTEWYKLQSMNFCHKLYMNYPENKGKQPEHAFALNSDILKSIEKKIDEVNDAKSNSETCPVIPKELVENDPKMKELYSSLYTYVAMESRGLSMEKAEEIVNKSVRNSVWFNESKKTEEKNVDNNKKDDVLSYSVGDKAFNSSIPIIKADDSYVGIEYLGERTLVNITLVKDVKITKYNGVHLKINKDLLLKTDKNA